MGDFIDGLDYDNHHSIALDDEIWSVFADESGYFDFSVDDDTAIREVLRSNCLALEAALNLPPNAIQISTSPPVSSTLPPLSRADGEALRLIDPTLRIPEEVLPLDEAAPSTHLLPRDRQLHQYDAYLYPFGRSFDITATPAPKKPNQAADHDSTNVAIKKRPASDSLTSVNKTRKTGHDQKSTVAQGITVTSSRLTTSMATQAPQAAFVVGGPLPPPTSEDNMAMLSKIVTMRAANNSNYNDLMKDRPPPNVCLPLNTDIIVAELMTFLTNSVQIPLFATRFMRNGFKVQTLAKMQLHAIGDQNEKHAAKVEGKLKWQYKHAGECEWRHLKEVDRTSWSGIAKKQGSHHDLTANHLKLRHEYPGWELSQRWGHCKMRDIYDPVEDGMWPQGADRMIVTQCLEFAKNNPQLDLDTSHWEWIVQHINAQQPPVPAGYATRDEEAASRYASIHPTRKALSDARRA